MRVAVIAALFLLSLVPWRAQADERSAPLHVDFRVEDPAQKTALISGSMEAEPLEPMRYMANQVGPVALLELHLFLRPAADGTVGVELQLRENDADGHTIDWRPALAGKRGAPLTATVHAGDVTRTVTVTVR